ncbi:MAG: ABC transporter ATP-binding protein [Dehalococcoidia bacterium]
MPSATAVPPAAASLSLSRVAHDYQVEGRAIPALLPVDLTIAPGEFVSIIGPSGCGKSTLLRIAGGLLAPSAGTVRAGDRSPHELQRSGQVGFVFQDPSLLPWRTVASNIRLVQEISRAHRRAVDVDRLLRLVGLAGYRDYYPHQLSGGMKQRVALARSLALQPTLLLMDEPFGALDEITRAQLRDELLALRERFNATVLFVTHSIAEAILLSDRVVVMSGSPGRLALTLPIDLPRIRSADLEEQPHFQQLARQLRFALRGGI